MKILKARYRNKEDFLEAYNEDLPHGGLFCPTTQPVDENEPVVVEVHFPELPNKMMFRGSVVWWRSALPRLRVRAGALVAFPEEDADKTSFLLAIAGGEEREAIKRRHPRIPVVLQVGVRPKDSTSVIEGELQDISVGGALLFTDGELAVGDEVIIELTTPGGASPVEIAAKVTHRGSKTVGVRFLYRDGGGSQRLREIVRRLVAGKKG
jgi:Tfp pilus assembly protein PilZ